MQGTRQGSWWQGFSAQSADDFVRTWLIIRTLLWTALLVFTQPTLPLDVLEHLAWGREWRLVYSHHPGLPAWINETLNILTGGSHLALSMTTPLATTAAMAGVWCLARRLTDSPRAAAAALSLEGVWYFNITATEFNHNLLQLAICAWLFFLLHRCFVGAPAGDSDAAEQTGHKQARRDWQVWALLGAAAALSLWAKYSSVLFLAAAGIWSLVDARAKDKWWTFGPWLALLVFIALTLPQLWALAGLQFAPFQFALDRAASGDDGRWLDHIVHPLRFGAAQLLAVLPALLLLRLVAWQGGCGASGQTCTGRLCIPAAGSGLSVPATCRIGPSAVGTACLGYRRLAL